MQARTKVRKSTRVPLFLTLAALLCAVGGTLPSAAADASKPVSPPTSDPFNDRLSVTVAGSGRFTQGAFPSSTGGTQAGSFTTLYGWPWAGTSFTTVRIDGSDYVFGDGGTMVHPPTDSGTANDTVWAVAGVEVTQHLQLVTNPATGMQDTAAITYSTRNTDAIDHTVGIRVMLDTDVNNNDGAPFRVPGIGAVTTETDLTGTTIPDTFQVFQDLADTTHVAAATLRGAGATPPDRVVIAGWPHLYPTRWDYTPDPSARVTNDSAYAVYWNPIAIAAGSSRAVTTYYGLSNVTVDLTPPVALGLSGPTELSAVDGGYSPSPFTVTATVSDSGTASATGVTATLNLPDGLRTSSPITTPVGTLTPGSGEQQLTWMVTADPRDTEATMTYSVTVTADNTAPKTVSRDLFVPRTTAVLPNQYVALGDSYQSGEGAYSYQPGTDTSTDKCHRSTVAYPFLVGSALSVNTTSVACSGAVIANLSTGQNQEGPQFNALSSADTLVSVGIGGNDLHFADIIRSCALGPQLSGGGFFTVNQTCHGRFDQQVNEGVTALETPDPTTGLSPLATVYNQIRAQAPHARIVVVGYPQFFTRKGNFFGCNLIWRSDQVWINAKVKEFDDAIAREAALMGAEYVAGADEFADGHELCDSGPAFLNGVILDGAAAAHESFHPNVVGHRRIADLILAHLASTHPANTFPIGQGQTISSVHQISPGQAAGSFLATWPGSDVTMTLTDPAGRTYSRDNTGGAQFHSNGPTSELFVIKDPQPGDWTVQLYGAQIAPGGENVNLTVSQVAPANKLPVGLATQIANAAGTTVTYDGRGSYDPDGTISSYEWDFGDGTAAAGPVVTHTYTNLGHLDQPTLIVTDNRGDQGFLTLPSVVVHYAFDGFRAPAPRTGAMHANAGRTIPFKWALTNTDGTPMTALSAVTAYGFDTAGATFSLTYDTQDQQYVLEAKTPAAWAGTARTFSLTLDDQSVHTQVVTF